jgi:hypothetical protein
VDETLGPIQTQNPNPKKNIIKILLNLFKNVILKGNLRMFDKKPNITVSHQTINLFIFTKPPNNI